MTISFEKWHGAGNDFVLIEEDQSIPDLSAFAKTTCDPNRGVGADGVLVLDLLPATSPASVRMRLFQPDGSTAAMCGNGARCVAKWAANRTGESTIAVITEAGERLASIDEETVAIEMGEYSFDPTVVPLDRAEPLFNEEIGELCVTAVNTGVPHAVSFVEDVESIVLEEIAPPIRSADVFPEGANVTIADTRTDGYRQRTFERGVEGETVACGTGAVAIAAVAYNNGEIACEEEVVIRPPGGALGVTIHADETATLVGPVTREFEGEIDPVTP